MSPTEAEAAEIDIKYSGFIKRQVHMWARPLMKTVHFVCRLLRLQSLSLTSPSCWSHHTPIEHTTKSLAAICCSMICTQAQQQATVMAKAARPLPPDLDYMSISTLSMESREKLAKVRWVHVPQGGSWLQTAALLLAFHSVVFPVW